MNHPFVPFTDCGPTIGYVRVSFTPEEIKKWHQEKRERETRPSPLAVVDTPVAVCIHCQRPFGLNEGTVTEEIAICDMCRIDRLIDKDDEFEANWHEGYPLSGLFVTLEEAVKAGETDLNSTSPVSSV